MHEKPRTVHCNPGPCAEPARARRGGGLDKATIAFCVWGPFLGPGLDQTPAGTSTSVGDLVAGAFVRRMPAGSPRPGS
eukprot:6634560-Alexandrium_andersonii.AAC.1